MGHLDRGHPLGGEHQRDAADEVVEVRNMGHHVVGGQQVGGPALGREPAGQISAEELAFSSFPHPIEDEISEDELAADELTLAAYAKLMDSRTYPRKESKKVISKDPHSDANISIWRRQSKKTYKG